MQRLILSVLLIWSLTGFTCAVVSLQGGAVVVEVPLFDATPTREVLPTPRPLPALRVVGLSRNIRGCGSTSCEVIDSLPETVCVAVDPTVIEQQGGWVWLQVFDGDISGGAGWVAVKRITGASFVRFYADGDCTDEINVSLP